MTKTKVPSPLGRLRRPKARRQMTGRGDYSQTDVMDLQQEIDTLRKQVDRSLKFKRGLQDVGEAAGSMLPVPGGRAIGRYAGTKVAQLFGHGDYKLVGNSLMSGLTGNSNTVPVFSKNGRRGVRITEREYIGDVLANGTVVNGSTTFNLNSFQINPSNAACFPWLSTLGPLFEQWEPHGVVFEFVSTSSEFNGANQALGTVITATEYNNLDSPYPNKQIMEESDYAKSCKSSENLEHGIECAASERLTKVFFTGPVEPGDNPNLYNLGVFQIATQGMSTMGVTVGELWVSYDFTMYKKQLVVTGIQGELSSSTVFNPNAVSAGAPFIVVATIHQNTGGFSYTSNPTTGQLFFYNIEIGSCYQLTFTYGNVATNTNAFITGNSGITISNSFLPTASASLLAVSQYYITATANTMMMYILPTYAITSGSTLVITQVNPAIPGFLTLNQ
jgi:hypothetical protein